MSLITNVEPLKWDGSTLTRRTLGCKKTFLACGMMRKKTKKCQVSIIFWTVTWKILQNTYHQCSRSIDMKKRRNLNITNVCTMTRVEWIAEAATHIQLQLRFDLSKLQTWSKMIARQIYYLIVSKETKTRMISGASCSSKFWRFEIAKIHVE